MASSSKDTIYVDVDDEITSIIDKVENSKHSIVALVLPKRATVLQSVVNMRLLKRSADNSKKKLVLITSEAGLLPLAGITGLHVAKSLQSKPTIPDAPDTPEPEPANDLDEAAEAIAVKDSTAEIDDTETVDFDNDEDAPLPATLKDDKDKDDKKVKKNKRLAVPNFDKFRVMFFGGIGLVILLIIAVILAIVVLPKAKITITTDSTPVAATMVATTTGAPQAVLDTEKSVIPATLQKSKKTDTEKVAATGSKDLGTKATGQVRLALKDCSQAQVSISSGTGVSSGGLTYITQSSVTLQRVIVGPNCNPPGNGFSYADVNVVAQSAGENYNIDPTTFTVTGQANVSATSSAAMTGGTSKIAKVVSQQDVDNAKQKIADKNKTAADEFKKSLTEQNLYILEETSTTSEPKITTTPAVGEEATEVTVTQEVTYSVLTVSKEDLTTLVNNALKKQIDEKTQKLQDGDVLEDATIRVSDKKNDTDYKISVDASTLAVPIIDVTQVKKDVAGKKKGDIQSTLGNRPGVKQVDVNFSPFWVSKVPKNTDKITIIMKTVSGDKN